MFQLEKYKGDKSRFTCPGCGARREFARYISIETGEYIAPTVGRCNRESKCGFHITPKEFFDANPHRRPQQLAAAQKSQAKKRGVNSQNRSSSRSFSRPPIEPVNIQPPDYIAPEILQKSLLNYAGNNFLRFLLELFDDEAGLVWQAVKNYMLGTTKDGRAIFWQIDQNRNIRTGKIVAYDRATGKRDHSRKPSFVHAELKRAGLLKEDFNLSQCFFGEHLLPANPDAPAAIVEAEKTALIASVYFPAYVWLATGGKRQQLKPERLASLGHRKILLYPDGDAFDEWSKIASDARRLALPVKVSSVIEKHATPGQKADGYDLADYLIEERRRVNEHNRRADEYNRKVDSILTDPKLFNKFNQIFDARLGELMLLGNLSREDAEARLSQVEEVRKIVYKVTRSATAGAR